MPIIKVDLKHAQDVEYAFSAWRSSLSPLEWQDVIAIEKLPYHADSPTVATSSKEHVEYHAAPHFIEFLKAKHIPFEDTETQE